jgi:hypothetical protein
VKIGSATPLRLIVSFEASLVDPEVPAKPQRRLFSAEEKKRILGLFRLFSGCWSKVQTSAVEVNRVNEILLVAKSASAVFDPLDFGVDGLAGGVGDSVS